MRFNSVCNFGISCLRSRSILRSYFYVLRRDSAASEALSNSLLSDTQSVENKIIRKSSSTFENVSMITSHSTSISDDELCEEIDNSSNAPVTKSCVVVGDTYESERPLELRKILRHPTFNFVDCASAVLDFRESVKVSLTLQIMESNGDVTKAVDILEYCHKRANGGGGFGEEISDYRLQDLKTFTQLLYGFAFQRVKSYAKVLMITRKILNLLGTLYTTKADLSIVYALVLVLVKHSERLKNKKLDEEEEIWKSLFETCLEQEIRHIITREKLDLNEILSSRQGRFLAMKEGDAAVVAKLKEFFPEFEPYNSRPECKNDRYVCPLVEELNEPPDFDKIDRFRVPLTHKELLQCFEDQLELERKMFFQLPAVLTPSRTMKKKSLSEHLEGVWSDVLLKRFSVFKRKLDEHPDSPVLRPFYNVLPEETYVNLIMQQLLNIIFVSNTGNPSSFQEVILLALGSGIKECVKSNMLEKFQQEENVYEIYKRYLGYISSDGPDSNHLSHRKIWQDCSRELYGERFTLSDQMKFLPYWPLKLIYWIAEPLLELWLQNVMVYEQVRVACNLFALGGAEALEGQKMIPAFAKVCKRLGDSSYYSILPSRQMLLLMKIDSATNRKIVYNCTSVPMLAPPVPRMEPFFGGLLRQPLDLVRKNFDHARVGDTKLRKWPIEHLFPILDPLNNLAAVPWKVNKKVLDTMIKFFQRGSDNLKLALPPAEENWPKLSDEETQHLKKRKGGKSYVEIVQKARQIFVVRRRYSFQQLLLLKRLSLVHFALKHEHCVLFYTSFAVDGEPCLLGVHYSKSRLMLRDRYFWFTNNMDFRGRSYPLSIFLSCIGPDTERSLLLFGVGRALGTKQRDCSGQFEFDGLDWLKIHLANLYGGQKSKTLIERRNFVNENLSFVMKSAFDPEQCTWWQLADMPWQVLATCFEISDAINSGNPETFVGHLPIHQDGSCNGLQHYAAIGRDRDGAAAVNVAGNSDGGPGDVYQRVADLVEQRRLLDACKGHALAKACEGLIDRSVVKQNVMTLVYGLTKHGAVEQLRDSLRKYKQRWLGEVADCLGRDFGQPMQWVTPLGFPVVQPYYSIKQELTAYDKANVSVVPDAESGVLELFKSHLNKKPSVRKHQSAVAANFIHSLDSSHMMLTALFCERAGVTFASVHDCFWTHPRDVNKMNEICREQFFRLHAGDIIGNIAKHLMPLPLRELENTVVRTAEDGELDRKLAAVYLMELLQNKKPQKGDLDLEEVKKTAYFFS